MNVRTAMRQVACVALIVAGVGCRPLPINDYVSPTKVVSTAPASIQLLGSTRPDQQLAVSAIVTTATGVPVSGVTVSFSVTAGTISPASAVTDADGTARAVATHQFQNTITARAGDLVQTNSIKGPAIDPLIVWIHADSTVYEDEMVNMGASVTSAPGATVRVVRWDFGDGSTTSANDFSQRHRYGREGTYTVALDVADSFGRTASGTKRITVREPAPPSTPSAPIPAPAPQITVTMTCSAVTPLRQSCTATPMFNGAAIATGLIGSMSITWQPGEIEPITPSVAIIHDYTEKGTYTVRIAGTLKTGEAFFGQLTITLL